MKWVELEQSQFHLAKIQSMLVDWMTLVYLADWPWTSSEVVFSYFQFWWLKNDLITEVTFMLLICWHEIYSTFPPYMWHICSKLHMRQHIFLIWLLTSLTVQTSIYRKKRLPRPLQKYLQCSNFCCNFH